MRCRASYNTDRSSINFLTDLAAVLNPAERTFLAQPSGYVTSGAASGFRVQRDSRISLSSRDYRVRGVDGRDGNQNGPVHKVLRATSAATHSGLSAPFAAASVLSNPGQTVHDARRLGSRQSLKREQTRLQEQKKLLVERQKRKETKYAQLITYAQKLEGNAWKV